MSHVAIYLVGGFIGGVIGFVLGCITSIVKRALRRRDERKPIETHLRAIDAATANLHRTAKSMKSLADKGWR